MEPELKPYHPGSYTRQQGIPRDEETIKKMIEYQSQRKKENKYNRKYRFTKEEYRYLHLVFLKDKEKTSEKDLDIKELEGLYLEISQVVYIKDHYAAWIKKMEELKDSKNG